MVIILPAHGEKYPKFSSYTLEMIEKVRDEPAVFKEMCFAAFENVGQLMSDLPFQAAQALVRGHPPLIAPTWFLDKDTTHYAEFNPANNFILINEYWVSQFEKDHEKYEARKFVKATVLHELVHYMDFLDGRLQDYDIVGSKKIPKPGVEERGEYFEKKVFGGLTPGWKHDR
jgi:hypothetical protein